MSAIAVDDSEIWVMKNANGSFSTPTAWSHVAFYGSIATVMADVDGRGYASAVAINQDSIWVMPVNTARNGFGPPQKWSGWSFFGSRDTVMADIDGSGRAAPVAINDNSIWVLPNAAGMGFGSPERRSNGAFMADLDGPGHGASAVAVTDNSIWVERNPTMNHTGPATFQPPSSWAQQPFYANWEYMADVDGSGRASAIAVSRTAIWVEQNTGAGRFGVPQRWFSGPFYGTH